MIAEIGLYALILAFFMAASQTFFGLAGAGTGRLRWMAITRPAAFGQLFFMALSYGCLTDLFVTSNYSVRYVAKYSNALMPFFYRVAGVWGAHEGSMMLWMLVLALWTGMVAVFSRKLPVVFANRVLGVLGAIACGFLLFTLITSNPFVRLLPPALHGGTLNPILEDPLLVIHPPMLYMGYVGLSVAFAFAVAALIGGRMDAAWARWTRPWTLAAWIFLTVGIVLGSFWSYYELGWGGWWFWDPVENASFMPWLIATALIHSLAVSEKRGAFKSWTALLAIAGFSLSLLGTFLVRSGVLISIHAFAMDPRRGMFILVLLGVMSALALAVYVWRAPLLWEDGGGFRFLSRETLILFNNILLVAGAAAVFIGTIYPLFIEVFGLGRLSVGPPYFDHVFIPIMFPLFILIGIGPYLSWKSGSLRALFRRLWISALLWLLVCLLLLLLAFDSHWPLMTWLGVLFGSWVLLTAFVEPIRRLWLRFRREPVRLPNGVLGMSLAHFGVGVIILGITVSTTLGVWRDMPLKPGQSYRMAGFRYRFDAIGPARGRNWTGVRATFSIFHQGRLFAVVHPEKRHFFPDGGTTTNAAIVGGGLHDLFVSLGNPLGQGKWSLRFRYEPMVIFVWLGGLLMALGGLLALADRRYRIALEVRPYLPIEDSSNSPDQAEEESP